MKKALFFDLDNTLYNYDLSHKHALRAVYDEFSKESDIGFDMFLDLYNSSKYEIHRELIGTASSHNRAIYLQRLIEKIKGTVNPRVILSLYETYRETFFHYVKPFDWVVALLSSLKDKWIDIAIVTNFTAQIQLRKIHYLGLDEYIDVLVSSEEAGSEKPHPSVFLMAANKLQVLPKDVVMVGDNPIDDIEGANHLQMTTILFWRKEGNVEKSPLQKPNYLVSNIPDLKVLLDELYTQ